MDYNLEISKLFSSRNRERWSTLIELNDQVATGILNKWFDEICSEKVIDIQTKTISHKYIDNRLLLRFCLIVYYKNGRVNSEIIEFEIIKKEKNNYKIVNIYAPPKKFNSNIKRTRVWKEICGHSCNLRDSKKWYDYPEFISYTAKTKEQIPANRYARSISRSIFAREENPQIECGILISTILSKKVYHLSKKYLENAVIGNSFIGELYDQFVSDFEVSMYNNERTDTWESKFTLPWRGIDELLFIQNTNDSIVRLNCHAFMSLFYSILLLNGVDKCNLVLANADHQIKLFIQDENEKYLMQRNNIISLAEQPCLGDALPSRLYGVDWILSARCSFIAQDDKERVLSSINDINRFWENRFIFVDPQYSKTDGFFINGIHDNILTSCLKARSSNTDSIYNWAMYCFQSLFVPQPSVYVISSLSSKNIKKYLDGLSESDFFSYFKSLNNESIFLESHRIMTAEQVILYGCGDCKSKALLYYTYNYIRGKRGCIVFTQNDYYCCFFENAKWVIFSINENTFLESIRGRVIFAFNEKKSWCFWHHSKWNGLNHFFEV